MRKYAEPLLRKGIAVIVLSAGALCNDSLRAKLERAAETNGALLYVPSGGIGGLDALKAACVAGVEEVTIAVTKPPAAWKGIAYVEKLKVDLDGLREPLTLYEGPAREGVPLFPANVNIAAVLSMAGIGFDRTRLKVVADPALLHNTHYIDIRGEDRQHQHQARERPGAGKSQDGVARLLQRAGGAESGEGDGPLRNLA